MAVFIGIMPPMKTPLHIIILAAGEGKRMRSRLPKVLQHIAGKPMLAHVIATARALAPAHIHVVYGHLGDQVRAAFAGQADLIWAEQAEQLGTGHAVQQAMPQIPDHARVLVMYRTGRAAWDRARGAAGHAADSRSRAGAGDVWRYPVAERCAFAANAGG